MKSTSGSPRSSPAPPTRRMVPGGCISTRSSGPRNSASASSASSARTYVTCCARTRSTPSSWAPRFSCAPRCTRCTRSTRRTAGRISARREGSGTATSRSVVPRSVPSRSRSRTTPSSRSRSAWWTRTTIPSRRCGGNSPASRSVSQSGPGASTQNQGESVASAQTMIVSTPREGAPAPRAPATAAPSAGATRPRVVIVGAGFGGLRAARALRNAPVDIVLVDRHNYHLFQPLLYQGATAGLEPEQIARPVRAVLRRQPNFEFRMVEVTGVDFAGRRVATDHGPVPYDFLILALGGETNYFGLDGIVRHGFGLKGVVDAVPIRNHVLRGFERAMLEPDAERRRALLTFVVVGGGPTGVEMAGALSELIRLVLVKDYPRLNIKDVRVLLLEATDRLL